MKLTELLSGIETLQRAGAPETDITSLGFDSRHATAGQLFFAVKGSASDGHDYMAQATANGAAAVVCERLPEEPFPGVAYIVVADELAALGTIASRFYGEPSHKLKLVGVTGTNGKTTTATLLYDLFRRLGYKAGLISTVVYRIDNETLPSHAHHAGRHPPQCHAGRDGGTRMRLLLHGGQFPQHRSGTHRRADVRRGYLHEHHARTPRLPRHLRRIHTRQETLFRPAAERGIRTREHRRPQRSGDGAESAPRQHTPMRCAASRTSGAAYWRTRPKGCCSNWTDSRYGRASSDGSTPTTSPRFTVRQGSSARTATKRCRHSARSHR